MPKKESQKERAAGKAEAASAAADNAAEDASWHAPSPHGCLGYVQVGCAWSRQSAEALRTG